MVRLSRDFRLSFLDIVITLVVITVFAIVIVPTIIRNPLSPELACRSKARSIVAALRFYAASSGGWTPQDARFYVRHLELPLPGDPAFSAAQARDVTHFVCPADEAPPRRPYGYPSSFRVLPDMVAENLAAPDICLARIPACATNLIMSQN